MIQVENCRFDRPKGIQFKAELAPDVFAARLSTLTKHPHSYFSDRNVVVVLKDGLPVYARIFGNLPRTVLKEAIRSVLKKGLEGPFAILCSFRVDRHILNSLYTLNAEIPKYVLFHPGITQGAKELLVELEIPYCDLPSADLPGFDFVRINDPYHVTNIDEFMLAFLTAMQGPVAVLFRDEELVGVFTEETIDQAVFLSTSSSATSAVFGEWPLDFTVNGEFISSLCQVVVFSNYPSPSAGPLKELSGLCVHMFTKHVCMLSTEGFLVCLGCQGLEVQPQSPQHGVPVFCKNGCGALVPSLD